MTQHFGDAVLSAAGVGHAQAETLAHRLKRLGSAPLQQAGRRHSAWHMRTADGREIDLVLGVERELWAIEIKLATNPSRSHTVCDLAYMIAYASEQLA